MDLELTAADREFLDEAKAFIRAHWRPPRGRGGMPGAAGRDAAERAWFEALVNRGWSVPHWPAAHGGTGWPVGRLYLWQRELELTEAPRMDEIGVDWAGPALLRWGDAAQQARYLPGIREARERWCLGFVEPHAGSDPQLTRTLARRESAAASGRDVYVVDGIKSWVAGAQRARWMLALVRAPAEGVAAEGVAGEGVAGEGVAAETALSLLVVDMQAPGVAVEPVRMLGDQPDICMVRLTGVRVPVGARLGAEGCALEAARALTALADRRLEPVAGLELHARRLQRVAAELPGDEGPLAEDPAFARKLADLGVDLAGLEALELRLVWGQEVLGSQQEIEEQQEMGEPSHSLWERSPDRDLEIAPTSAGRIAIGRSLPQEQREPRGEKGGDPQRDADLLPAMLRLRRTQISRRIGELFVEAFGYYSLPYPDPLTIDNEGPIGHHYALAALQGMFAGRSLATEGDAGEELRDRIANQLFGY